MRGSLVLHDGKLMWPAPVREPSPQQAVAATPAAAVVEEKKEPNYFQVNNLTTLIVNKSFFEVLIVIEN